MNLRIEYDHVHIEPARLCGTDVLVASFYKGNRLAIHQELYFHYHDGAWRSPDLSTIPKHLRALLNQKRDEITNRVKEAV